MSKKKDVEIEVSSFFIEKINSFYNFDYQISHNDEGKNGNEKDVDVYAISKSDIKNKLKLQLTTFDSSVLKSLAEMRKQYQKNGLSKVFLSSLTPEYCIKEAIARKKLHVGKEDLILIIHSEYSGQINKQYTKDNFSKFNDSDYKGVFWILMPNKIDSHTGQLEPIKNCFGEMTDCI